MKLKAILLLKLKHSVCRVILLQLVSYQFSILQAFTTCCVNKATPIHFIDSKCHIKQLRAVKSHKTCLTNHTHTISHHQLLIQPRGWTNTHTDTCTYALTKAISRNQACTSLRLAHTWFNYCTVGQFKEGVFHKRQNFCERPYTYIHCQSFTEKIAA